MPCGAKGRQGRPIQSANQPFCGGAGEAAGRTVEGEADEVDLLAAVTIGLGVALFFDLGEGLLGRTVDLELENEDAFGGLGDQIGAALGLAVLCGDAEEPAGGQQDVEDALEGEFLHALLFGAVNEMGVEVGEVTEEGIEVGLLQSPADHAEVVVVFLLCKFFDELGVEGTADLFIRDAKGEDAVLEIFDGEVTALVEHGDRKSRCR